MIGPPEPFHDKECQDRMCPGCFKSKRHIELVRIAGLDPIQDESHYWY